jgi:hypothetical protein
LPVSSFTANNPTRLQKCKRRAFAEQIASASNMKYFLLKVSDAQRGHYDMIWSQEAREKYLEEVIQQSLNIGEQ